MGLPLSREGTGNERIGMGGGIEGGEFAGGAVGEAVAGETVGCGIKEA